MKHIQQTYYTETLKQLSYICSKRQRKIETTKESLENILWTKWEYKQKDRNYIKNSRAEKHNKRIEKFTTGVYQQTQTGR